MTPYLPARRHRLWPWPAFLLLAACQSLPSGPEVLALPGSGKTLDEFRRDDASCQSGALAHIQGMTPDSARNESTARGAAIGTVAGGLAGAAIGGRGSGAIGAGTGLAVGSAVGAGQGDVSRSRLQQRYDFFYVQCMYGKGHRVPAIGHPPG